MLKKLAAKIEAKLEKQTKGYVESDVDTVAKPYFGTPKAPVKK